MELSNSELTLSEIIKLNRKRLKLSQLELADAVGVSRNYISIIERGYIGDVSWKVVNKILARLDIEIRINNHFKVEASEVKHG